MADIRINALATTATSAASDDYLALDGSANGTRKILATNVAQNVTDVTLGSAGPSVKSTLSARAPRQGLVFDGTAGATVSGPALGTGDFTVVAWVNPNSVAALQALVSGNTNAFSLDIAAGGLMEVRIAGGAILGTASSALVAGKTQMASVRRSGSTNTFNINGVDLASPFTDTSNFTQVISTVGSFLGGGYPFTGSLRILIYNRALSASEVVALYEAGAPAASEFGSPSAGNAVSLGAAPTYYGTLVIGKRYRYAITVSSYVSGNVRIGDGTTFHLDATANGTYTGDFVATGVTFNVGGTYSATISGVSCTAIGLLLAPDAAQAGNGYVWNDQSGNLAQIVLPSSGVQWNLPSVATNRIRGTTSTNGNQQLLGASVLLPSECQITHVRARARTGTPTITIGTASGGAQIVASVALSTTWLNCTIALTGGIVSSADDIWVGSNSTDVVETDIAFQPLDF